MVALYTFPACENGHHKACDGNIPAPKGCYGGAVCSCQCHFKPRRKNVKITQKQKDEVAKMNAKVARVLGYSSYKDEWGNVCWKANGVEYCGLTIPFATSLDAIVPEVKKLKRVWSVGYDKKDYSAHVQGGGLCHASTEAMALCLAVLDYKKAQKRMLSDLSLEGQ